MELNSDATVILQRFPQGKNDQSVGRTLTSSLQKERPLQQQSTLQNLKTDIRLRFGHLFGLAVFMLCFQSCSTAVPVTGCTSVSTNTGTGNPTTLPNKANPQLFLSERQSQGSDPYVFLNSFNDNNYDIALFGKNGGLLAKKVMPETETNYKSVILKDPLKLFFTCRTKNRVFVYVVTYSGSTYAIANARSGIAGTSDSSDRMNLCISEVGTNMIFCQLTSWDAMIRFDLQAGPTVANMNEWWGNYGGNSVKPIIYMQFMHSTGSVFSGTPIILSLYNKADFSQVKNFYYYYDSGLGYSSKIYAYCVDNLNDRKVFGAATKSPTIGSPSNQVFSYDMNPATVSGLTVPPLALGGYGPSTNNILNFGPYQYVVTIQQGSPAAVFLFVSKSSLSAAGSVTLSNAAANIAGGALLQGFVQDFDKFYFGLVSVDGANKNFQSYYLTVDRCVTKNGAGVCTQCLTPYYLMPIPGKECLLQADFPPGYGVKVALTTGAACTSTGCIDCFANYAVCAICNNAAGWYLKVSVCQHATLAPMFGPGFGPDLTTKQVVACAVGYCFTCAADKGICTKCDQANGWYLNGNACQSALAAPLFPSGFGPNTATGMVVACSEPRCIKCPTTFATCAECDTGAGWYLDQSKTPPQCQHATLAPVIAPGFGKSAGPPGKVLPCLTVNCVSCLADYSLCLACNTGAGWYLNTAPNPRVCQNAASFATNKGPNTATGLVASCADTHCAKCAATVTTCQTCDTAGGWYLSVTSNQCQSQGVVPQMPLGFGPDKSTGQPTSGQVKACTVVGCRNCSALFTSCVQCDTAAFFTLSAGNCLFTPPCLVGRTLANASIPNDPCIDLNCDYCCYYSSTCQVCKTGWYLDPVSHSCFSPTISPVIPDTKGANTVTKQVVSCLDNNCLKCKSDYSICTGCDTVTGWYLNGNMCQSPTVAPMIADGFGANLADGTVAACTDANCKLCKASTLVCTACQTSNGWFLNGNTCQHASNSPSFPPGFGPNTATGNVVACSLAHCLLCRGAFDSCTGCDTPNSWFFNVLANACQHPTDSPPIPDWYGGSSSSGTVLGCSDSYCVKCKASYQTCTGCDTANGWFLNGNTCQHASNSPSFPPGFGPNTATGNVVACSLAHCLECDAAFAVCTGCDKVAGWFMNNVANQCESKNAAPLFTLAYGPDTQSGFAVSCSVAHCSKCPDNYLICTGCDTSTGWYLNSDTGLCNHKSNAPQIPNSYGPNLATGILEKCDTIFCDECLDDFTVCTNCMKTGGYVLVDAACACDTSKQLFQDPKTQECINSDTLVDTGKGGNFTSRQVSSCLDAHCVDCHQNSSRCNKCNFAQEYYLTSNYSCLLLSDFPPGLGAFNESATGPGTALACVKEGCVVCQFDYSVCSQCDISKGYLLKNDSCKMKPADVRLTVARFSTSLLTAEIKFSAPLSKNSKLDQPFNIRFVDVVTKLEYSCKDISCALKSIDVDGFTLVFNASYELIKGDFYIERSDNMILKFEDEAVWINYPIKVPEFAFISKKGLSAAAGTAMTAMNSARMPLSIAISFAAPAAASFIDGLLNTLFLLKMLEGPGVSFPDSILAASMDTNLIPIDMGNPFQSWVDTANSCKVSAQLLKQGVTCNMLDNEGTNIVQIAGVAVTTLIVAYSSFYLLRYIVRRWLQNEKKEKENSVSKSKLSSIIDSQNKKENVIGPKDIKRITKLSRLAQVVQRIGLILGFQFMITKMEGYQIEMTFMSVVGIKHSSRSSVDAFSTVVSLAFIFYYASIAACCFRQSLWIWDQVEALQAKHRGRRSFKNSLGFYIHFERAPFFYLNYLFEELKVPDEYWKLLLPVVIYLRSTAMCLAVTLVLGKPWQQVTLVTMAESLMLAFEIAANPRYSRAEHWADILLKTCTIIYLLLKLLTTSESLTEPTRQVNVGTAMAGVLFALMVVGFGFAIYTLVVMLVAAFKSLIAKVKAMKDAKTAAKEEEVQPMVPRINIPFDGMNILRNSPDENVLVPPAIDSSKSVGKFKCVQLPMEAKERHPDSPFQIDKSSDPKAKKRLNPMGQPRFEDGIKIKKRSTMKKPEMEDGDFSGTDQIKGLSTIYLPHEIFERPEIAAPSPANPSSSSKKKNFGKEESKDQTSPIKSPKKVDHQLAFKGRFTAHIIQQPCPDASVNQHSSIDTLASQNRKNPSIMNSREPQFRQQNFFSTLLPFLA